MSDYHFDTPRPVRLFTEIGRGSVRITATTTTHTEVQVTGRDADQVLVDLDGDQISVVGPRQRGFFGGDNRLDVVVTLPVSSALTVRTGSADIVVTGTIATARLKSGSGDIAVDVAEGPVAIDTGSGDIRIEAARAELKVKSGSGDVTVAETGTPAVVSTGSGDVFLGRTGGRAVVKTGSGDLQVGAAVGDLALSTGSGDLVVTRAEHGRISVRGASGDVAVAIAPGTAVWTDISTISGEIRSAVEGRGAPGPDTDRLEIRARTVSGDVVLTEA